MNVSSNIANINPASIETFSAGKISEQAAGNEDGKVGKKFESLFYSMLLKEMRESLNSDGEGGLFPGDDSDTLGGMFDIFMSDHLSQSSTLGIAEAVDTYLKNKKIGGDNENTGVSNPESDVPKN